MSMPVPLGVRIFNPTIGLDMWVTRYVSGLTYRSVIPGGFASASFTLQTPQNSVPTTAAWAPRPERIPLVRLFNRVQIVDQRSGAIAWEGRIESAARSQNDPWAWDIGCAGAMVAATDITRPVFYVDSDIDEWIPGTSLVSFVMFDYDQNEATKTLTATLDPVYPQWIPGDAYRAYQHELARATGQYVGRFSCTYGGPAVSATNGSDLRIKTSIYSQVTSTEEFGIDSTAFGTLTRKSNAIGGSSSFTTTTGQSIRLTVENPSSTHNINLTSATTGQARWVNPVVVALRMDRKAVAITDPAQYGTDYVTVSQVVEDVLGRFLNGGWSNGSLDNPAPGSVSPVNSFIDTSDSTPITNLKYRDGASAATILNDMMTVQTDAYWAIWESPYGATDDPAKAKYRFEWSTWDDSWGYLVGSDGGMDEQPDASDIYNFVYLVYNHVAFDGSKVPIDQVQESWDSSSPPSAPLLSGIVTRSSVIKDNSRDNVNSAAQAATWIKNNGKEKNAGAITIRRPVQAYGSGIQGYAGVGGMTDPHMIRPGRLLRISDVMAAARNEVMTHGDTPSPVDHTGSVWKVVAATYDAERNECVLELDQPSTWSVPGQIVTHSGNQGNIRKLVS